MSDLQSDPSPRPAVTMTFAGEHSRILAVEHVHRAADDGGLVAARRMTSGPIRVSGLRWMQSAKAGQPKIARFKYHHTAPAAGPMMLMSCVVEPAVTGH